LCACLFVSVCDLADGRESMQFKFAADITLEKAVTTLGRIRIQYDPQARDVVQNQNQLAIQLGQCIVPLLNIDLRMAINSYYRLLYTYNSLGNNNYMCS